MLINAIGGNNYVKIRQPYLEILEHTKNGKVWNKHPLSSKMYNVFKDIVKYYSIFKNLKWEESFITVSELGEKWKHVQIQCQDSVFREIIAFKHFFSNIFEYICSVNDVVFISNPNLDIISYSDNLYFINDKSLKFFESTDMKILHNASKDNFVIRNIRSVHIDSPYSQIFQFDKDFFSIHIKVDDEYEKFNVYSILKDRQNFKDVIKLEMQCRTVL